MIVMAWRDRFGVDEVLHYLTTERAVRAGVLQAAWSVAPSYARGLLPRTPTQQAAATGTVVVAHYALGTVAWAGISSLAAGLPGARPGPRALLVGATVGAVGGKALEIRLRQRAGDDLPTAAIWALARTTSVASLAGGLVTVGDFIAHDALGLPASPRTTLAVDVALGGAMAAGTVLRRMRRQRKHGLVEPQRQAITGGNMASIGTVAGVGVGTAVGLTALAIGEQNLARGIATSLDAAVGAELGEAGVYVSHMATLAGFGGLAVLGLRRVRKAARHGNLVIEPAYPNPPTSMHVSCGPASSVDFDAIGKEGRRFVLMALTGPDITAVMREPAVDPVRIVIGRHGSVAERAQFAVAELQALGGFDRGLICVASPTGVGYVNYSAAEALEYLSRGDCATVVPQYALVPSALALNKTNEGSSLQSAVLSAIRDHIATLPPQRRPRLVQFGESLGAQVALDIIGQHSVRRMDAFGLDSGLYLGVPFRSSTWRRWSRARSDTDPDGRLVLVPDAGDLDAGHGRHVMICHHDDPVNKFAYSMVVQPPPWMGTPESRPPKVPRETLFRPVTTFVLTLVDVLNGMNSKPGEFELVGHDYRIDLERSFAGAFDLPRDAEQAERIERALRDREQLWAEVRLVAKAGERALRQIKGTLDKWGRGTANLQMMESDQPESALARYLNDRLGAQAGKLGTSGAPD